MHSSSIVLVQCSVRAYARVHAIADGSRAHMFKYVRIYGYVHYDTYVRIRTRPKLSSFVDVYDVEQEICDGVSGHPGSRGGDACLRPAFLLQPLQN